MNEPDTIDAKVNDLPIGLSRPPANAAVTRKGIGPFHPEGADVVASA